MRIGGIRMIFQLAPDLLGAGHNRNGRNRPFRGHKACYQKIQNVRLNPVCIVDQQYLPMTSAEAGFRPAKITINRLSGLRVCRYPGFRQLFQVTREGLAAGKRRCGNSMKIKP